MVLHVHKWRRGYSITLKTAAFAQITRLNLEMGNRKENNKRTNFISSPMIRLRETVKHTEQITSNQWQATDLVADDCPKAKYPINAPTATESITHPL